MANERRRNSLFSKITDNTAVGKDAKKKLDSINKDIDEYLYEFSDDAKKMQIDADETYESMKHLNSPYNDILTTGDLLEFLTQNTLVNINNVYRKQQRVLNMNKDGDISSNKQQINEMLMNTDVTQLLSAEKDRITKYSDYRLIDAYIPQVSRCINTYRDSILSPDDNNKTDITISYEMSFQDTSEEEKVNTKIKDLYDRIKFYKKAKSWIHSGLVDGDVFVAVLRYATEMNTMLLKEDINYFTNGDNVVLTEEELFSDFSNNEDTVLMENLFSEEIEAFSKGKDDEKKSKKEAIGIVKKKITDSIQNNVICIKDSKTEMKYGQYAFNSDVEGLDEKLTIPGCLVRTLPPESTIALALDDDTVMGYLYFEKYDTNSEFGREGFGLNVKDLLTASIGGDTYLNSTSSTASSMGTDFYMSTVSTRHGSSDGNANSADYFNSMNGNGINVAKTKFITELFVKGISKKLNKKIIEQNQQFREIIYQLVKKDYLLNKKVKIVYYAPNEVFHYKPDCDGGIYGNSKISKVYFYCKMLLSTLLTTVMQKISRGRDKRVLYVETGLDDDIEDSIQEVVRD